jgi:predicted kinase
VPRLIHLNGPPGIGKSTIAQLYAEHHPGVLNLDIDQVRGLIGGWRERFAETGRIVRPIALGMARAQLDQGLDVVMPQYLGKPAEIGKFETVARDCGAEFAEIVLMDSKEHALQRFDRRGEHDDAPHHAWIREVVRQQGGTPVLVGMYDQLTDLLRTRPKAIVIMTVAGAIQETYRAVTAALALRA